MDNTKNKHIFEICQLVEAGNGSRLFVVEHTRGGDNTPTYTLSPYRQEWVPKLEQSKWSYGYREEQLTGVMAKCDVMLLVVGAICIAMALLISLYGGE